MRNRNKIMDVKEEAKELYLRHKNLLDSSQLFEAQILNSEIVKSIDSYYRVKGQKPERDTNEQIKNELFFIIHLYSQEKENTIHAIKMSEDSINSIKAKYEQDMKDAHDILQQRKNQLKQLESKGLDGWLDERVIEVKEKIKEKMSKKVFNGMIEDWKDEY